MPGIAVVPIHAVKQVKQKHRNLDRSQRQSALNEFQACTPQKKRQLNKFSRSLSLFDELDNHPKKFDQAVMQLANHRQGSTSAFANSDSVWHFEGKNFIRWNGYRRNFLSLYATFVALQSWRKQNFLMIYFQARKLQNNVEG